MGVRVVAPNGPMTTAAIGSAPLFTELRKGGSGPLTAL
jgi:hypothetical protein